MKVPSLRDKLKFTALDPTNELTVSPSEAEKLAELIDSAYGAAVVLRDSHPDQYQRLLLALSGVV